MKLTSDVADLKTLSPYIQPWAQYLYQIGKQYSGRLVVTSAFRSLAKQAELRHKWETGQSKIPANRPGASLHNYRRAFDMAQLGIDPFEDPLLPYLGQIWTYWGGRYGGVRDPVHFES